MMLYTFAIFENNWQTTTMSIIIHTCNIIIHIIYYIHLHTLYLTLLIKKQMICTLSQPMFYLSKLKSLYKQEANVLVIQLTAGCSI